MPTATPTPLRVGTSRQDDEATLQPRMTSESIVDISDLFREVDGLYISKFFDEDTLRSALSYEPRPEEIFIVTYPKCGTTWTQYIVHSILNDGVFPKDFTDFA
ncbi:hypothetical protein HPB47_004839 [Ixodes persulcatus]|uniref:Uncharacterized protein n=1 Tax=Ixodes persulcatus TaxID=34615 RepID=A0AC60PF76_IXOPE|nr:hypothetical protein HPB47_004839 [Ixodes persulcatus]